MTAPAGRRRRAAPAAPRVLVLHGPNLNLLGTREPLVYGRVTLAEINAALGRLAKELGALVTARQSNHEGDLVTHVQKAPGRYVGLLVNPAGLTHTSVSLRDAISAAGLPTIEVHLSNIDAREEFRRHSLTAGVCLGRISGFGWRSYTAALRVLCEHLELPRPG